MTMKTQFKIYEVKWSEVKSLRCVQLFVTPWTVAYQAPPSMGFSRQDNWSGLPCPPPGNLPDPGMEPGSPYWQANSLPSEPPGKPYKECYFDSCFVWKSFAVTLKMPLLIPKKVSLFSFPTSSSTPTPGFSVIAIYIDRLLRWLRG